MKKKSLNSLIKKLILFLENAKIPLIMLLFIHLNVSAQTSLQIGKNYVFTVTTPMYKSDILGKHAKNNENMVISPVYGRFMIIDETDSTYIIKFYKWVINSKKNLKDSSFYKSQTYKIKTYNVKTLTLDQDKTISAQTYQEDNIQYFVVYKLNFDKKCVSTDSFSRWSAVSGTLVMPFKLRPQRGDFTKDITINGIVGVGRRIYKNNTINGILGVGISSVTLDSVNTEGKIRQSSDRAAMSISCGLLYQYKQIQIGGVIGWDILNKSSVDNWVYNNKSWISIGVGVNIFRTEENSKENVKPEN